MSNAIEKTPNKRKSFGNANSNNTPKKVKLDNIKSPNKQGNKTPNKQGKKTPNKQGNNTPNNKQTNNTPNKQGNKTPNKQGNKTPNKQGKRTPGKFNSNQKGQTPNAKPTSGRKNIKQQKISGDEKSNNAGKLKMFEGTVGLNPTAAQVETEGSLASQLKKEKPQRDRRGNPKPSVGKKRKNHFFKLDNRLQNKSKDEVIQELEARMKAIEGRGEMTKTSRRKLKLLKKMHHLTLTGEKRKPPERKTVSNVPKKMVTKKQNTPQKNKNGVAKKNVVQSIKKRQSSQNKEEDIDNEDENIKMSDESGIKVDQSPTDDEPGSAEGSEDNSDGLGEDDDDESIEDEESDDESNDEEIPKIMLANTKNKQKPIVSQNTKRSIKKPGFLSRNLMNQRKFGKRNKLNK